MVTSGSRQGIDRRARRRRAAVLLVAGLGIAACTDDVPNDQAILDLEANPDSLGVGRCMNVPDDVADTINSLPPHVGCENPHTHEIYAVIDMASFDPPPFDVYPGFDELEQFAQRECLDRFEAYVGISAFDSTLFYSWIVPSLKSWQDETTPDREVLCVAGLFDGGTREGSVKGSGI